MISFQADAQSYVDTQMPKRSWADDQAKAMVGKGALEAKEKPKSSNTGRGKGKGSGPINIPLDNISPELKKILIKEMIKGGGGGKAKLVKKQGGKKQGK